MNKTDIEWCDYTWNPVTGCLHGCEYCYARGIAKRFEGGGYGKEMDMFFAKYKDGVFQPPYELCKPQWAKTKIGWYRKAPYPFGFAPTFHRYRLPEPAKMKKPQNIFVVSMGDLFGEWVPDEWIRQVFEACEAAPQHNYLFLTKNPDRYFGYYGLGESFDCAPENWWFGATRATGGWAKLLKSRTFLSIEPLLQDVARHFENDELRDIDWVILGAETGNRKNKIIPKREWIEAIVNQCRAANVPVFMKNSLADIWGEPLIQEWPEGLK